jgi:outer membrane protein OmpA-like peptidoglycan-associated protein
MKTRAAEAATMTLFAAHHAKTRTWPTAVAVMALLGLGACSSDKPATDAATAEAPAESGTSTGSGGFVTGGAFGSGTASSDSPFVAPGQAGAAGAGEASAAAAEEPPKFETPKPTGKGAPDLASVPSKPPEPPSSREERAKTTEGLIADRERARYSDQGGRTQPLTVRPLTEAAATPETEPAAPPKPDAARVQPVTRLGNQKPPQQGEGTPQKDEPSVAAAAQMAATATPPPPPPEMMAGPRPSGMPQARTDGFRALTAYQTTESAANQVATIDFSGTGTSITASGRRALSEAAKLGERTKGAFRVIGRAADPTNLAQERATAVARELQRLGVTQDRIYVGTDTGTDGRVDVILDQ